MQGPPRLWDGKDKGLSSGYGAVKKGHEIQVKTGVNEGGGRGSEK